VGMRSGTAAREFLNTHGPLLVAGASSCFYVVMAVLYVVHLPVGGGPDEREHVQYIDVLLDTRTIPVLPGHGAAPEREAQQAQHPPAYYALLALPRALTRHWPDEKSSVVVLRFVSLGIGLLALPLVWLTARTVWPDRPWHASIAVSVFALMPNTQYMTSVVNNSVCAMVTSALVVLLAARILVRRNHHWRAWLALGGAMGLLLVTKTTGVQVSGVAAVVLVAGLLRLREPETRRSALVNVACLCASCVVIVAPWVARNQALYGQAVAERVTTRSMNQSGLLGFLLYPEDAIYVLKMGFGKMVQTTVTPFWVIRPFDFYNAMPYYVYAIVAAAAAGVVISAAGRAGARRAGGSGPRNGFLLGVATSISCGILMVTYMTVRDVYIYYFTGRYLWEFAGGLALLAAMGLLRYPGKWVRVALIVAVLAVLVGMSLYSHDVVVTNLNIGLPAPDGTGGLPRPGLL